MRAAAKIPDPPRPFSGPDYRKNQSACSGSEQPCAFCGKPIKDAPGSNPMVRVLSGGARFATTAKEFLRASEHDAGDMLCFGVCNGCAKNLREFGVHVQAGPEEFAEPTPPLRQIEIKVCDVTIRERLILIPDKCPRCTQDFVPPDASGEDMKLHLIEYQDQSRYAYASHGEGEKPGSVDWCDDLPQAGESFIPLEWACAHCGHVLASGKEKRKP